jgi:hypothetical protein
VLVPFVGNDARASHHGLAATAAYSREAGYIFTQAASDSRTKDLANPGRTIHFLIAAPSRQHCRESTPPTASSACGSQLPASSAAWPPTHPSRRIWLSSCTASLRRSRACAPGRPPSPQPHARVKTAMICSSVNLTTLHRPSLQKSRTLILRGGETQWQVIKTPSQAILKELGKDVQIRFA